MDELGCVPLSTSRKVQVVKHWHRLISENEKLYVRIYLRKAYLLAKLEKLLDISDIFKSLGLDHPMCASQPMT